MFFSLTIHFQKSGFSTNVRSDKPARADGTATGGWEGTHPLEGAARTKGRSRGRARLLPRTSVQNKKPHCLHSKEWECGSDLLFRAVCCQVRWKLGTSAKPKANWKRQAKRAEQPAGRSATIERANSPTRCLRLSMAFPCFGEYKKPDQRKLIGNWNAAATYSPGPSPAKYHRRAEA